MTRFIILWCAAALIAIAGPAIGADAAEQQKLVIQVSDNDQGKWNLALNNAENVQAELGAANVDIEIVLYGPGINMAKMESPLGERVREAIGKGVKFAVCENTMHNAKVTKDDMLPSLGYVKAGVIELMRRQQEGYAYIRP